MLLCLVALPACNGGDNADPRAEPVEPIEEPDPRQPEVKPDFRVTRDCELPSIQDIATDPVVGWAMRDRLRRSFVGAERAHANEEGAWIYQCKVPAPGGEISYHLDVALVEDGLRHAAGGRTIGMIDTKYLPHMPGRPDCRTVGAFHTHLHSGQSMRKPSDADKENHESRGVPSFIVVPDEPFEDAYVPYRRNPVAYSRIPKYEPIPHGDWTEIGKQNLSWTCDAGSCPVEPDGAEITSTTGRLDPCSCFWTARMSGDVEREMTGGAVNLGRLSIGEGRVISSIELAQAPGSEGTDGLAFWLSEELAERDFRLGPRQDHGAGLGTREVPFSFAANGALRVSLHEPDAMVVGGFALAYGGMTLPDFEMAELQIRGRFVWTPSCPTVMEQLFDVGRRTAEFVEGLEAESHLP